MKVRVVMKDPDTMHDAVEAAVQKDVARTTDGLEASERADIAESRAEAIRAQISDKWMHYSEYLCVEFDTDAGTATVIESDDY